MFYGSRSDKVLCVYDETCEREYRDDGAKMQAESFMHQQEGRFDACFMKKFQDEILMYLKPKYTEKVMNSIKVNIQ